MLSLQKSFYTLVIPSILEEEYKWASNNLMDKLCIIHLFEADYNFNIKRLGKAILSQAKHLYLMADEQYDI